MKNNEIKVTTDRVKKDKLKNNIKLDYLYKFLQSLDISAAIWMLYLAYKGLSLVEIGILEGLFHVVSLICEVPTGAIADILGRKNTIVIGRLLSALSSILMLLGTSFGGFAIAFAIQAISYNLNSGSEEALVYDSLKLIGGEEEYIKVNGTLNLIIEVAQGVAVLVGGILSDYAFSYSYILAVIISLCAFGVSLGFKEPEIHEDKAVRLNAIQHFKTCFKVMKNNKKIILMMLFFEGIFMVGTTTHFYSQQYFSDLGYSRSYISIIYVVASVGCALGAKYVYIFEEKLKDKIIYVLPAVSAIALMIFSFISSVGSIASFMIFSVTNNMLYPVSSSYINKLIPSEQRATLISVQSMCFSIFMIVFFPLMGLLGQVISLRLSFTILSIVLGVMGFIGYYSKEHRAEDRAQSAEHSAQ